MTIILCLLLAPLLVINLVFAIEILAGLPHGQASSPTGIGGQAVILIPAHDEALVIAKTLDRLSDAASGFRILVVADNCDDDTAAIARRSGVDVIERHDPQRRGKGHALAFARDWLRSDPPAAVIVLDADCHTNSASLAALVEESGQSGRPGQAVNLLEPGLASSPMVQVSTFAFLIKNLVRQRGLQRLADVVHLTGTGMCIPWTSFDKAQLATSAIVEDIRLGLELARQGSRPRLIDNAVVWSAPSDSQGTLTQRRRWEGGYIAMALAAAPPMLAKGLRTLDWRTLLSGLDLLIPPLALLALFNAAALLTTIGLAIAGITSWLPVGAVGTVGALVLITILATWWREGRAFISSRALLSLPLYALWKVPMYFGLARSGAPSEWLRTGRQSQTDREA